jgi:hypothetical protein
MHLRGCHCDIQSVSLVSDGPEFAREPGEGDKGRQGGGRRGGRGGGRGAQERERGEGGGERERERETALQLDDANDSLGSTPRKPNTVNRLAPERSNQAAYVASRPRGSQPINVKT